VGSDHRSTLEGTQPDAFLALDFADPERAASQAVAFAAEHPLAAVTGVDDDTTVLAAHLSAALGTPHNPVAACLAARDKFRQRSLLSGAGLPVPAFALHRFDEDPAALALSVTYPCVLKPTRLSMSRGVMRADSPSGFAAALSRLRAILSQPDAAAQSGADAAVFLVEQFVPGREYALEGLLVAGSLLALAIFDKPDPLDGPFFEETIYVTPSHLRAAVQQSLAATVERAAHALGLLQGPVHAELRVNEAGPWMIELAARPIGGRCSAVLRFGDAGAVSLEELVLRHALGLPLPSTTRERRAAAVLMVPTRTAGVLRRVLGVEDARRVPWVDDVVITAHPGQTLVPLPEGSQYLGFVYAIADDADTAVRALREAETKLRVETA
jgi:biotin carboxylase